MTQRTGNAVTIKAEDDDFCELCGLFEETRPYGPGGKRVCFKCGMDNEDEARRQFDKLLDGETIQ